MTSLIILHGWGHSAAQWQQFAQMFSDQNIVTLDMPGFGTQRLISDEWGVPEYGEWVMRQALGIRHQISVDSRQSSEIVLLGHSFGGRVAAYIASRRPTWLKKLVLVGAPCLYQPSQKIRLLKCIAKVAKLLGIAQSPFSLNAELTDAEKAGLGHIYRRVVSHDQTDELKHIDVPTLILRGNEDTYPGEEVSALMHKYISKSTYQVLPHVGHNIHLENPVLLYGIVTRFISDTSH